VNTKAIQALVAQWQAANATYIRRYDRPATPESITLKFADDTETVTLYLIEQEAELILARPDWGIEYHFPDHMRKMMLGLQAAETEIGPVTHEQREPPQPSP
jgi:hypothetical protein